MKIAFDAFMVTLCLCAAGVLFLRCEFFGFGVNAISAGIWLSFLRHDLKDAKK